MIRALLFYLALVVLSCWPGCRSTRALPVAPERTPDTCYASRGCYPDHRPPGAP